MKLTGKCRNRMIKHALLHKSEGKWKIILYALCYGAEIKDIRRVLSKM